MGWSEECKFRQRHWQGRGGESPRASKVSTAPLRGCPFPPPLPPFSPLLHHPPSAHHSCSITVSSSFFPSHLALGSKEDLAGWWGQPRAAAGGSNARAVMYAEPSTMNFRNHGFFRRSPPPSVAKPAPTAGNALSVLGGIAQISPCLYLCSGNAASNRHMVYSRAVTCIVNATMEIPNANWPDIDYVKVPVPDLPHAPLSLYFDSVADRIHQTGKKNGRTLVHCVAGVSRSASLCIAYLMKYHRLSLLDAHEWVKSRRPVVRPNVGFWRQLIEYERKLFGKNTVKMVPSPIGLVPDVYEKETRGLVPLWNLR